MGQKLESMVDLYRSIFNVPVYDFHEPDGAHPDKPGLHHRGRNVSGFGVGVHRDRGTIPGGMDRR